MTVKNTDYSHVVEDVKAAIKYILAAESGGAEEEGQPITIGDLLYRAGLRTFRAEKGLKALNNVIDTLADKHSVELPSGAKDVVDH